MKMPSLIVTPAKSSAKSSAKPLVRPTNAGLNSSRVITTSQKPVAHAIPPKPTVSSQDRKRGQRVLLRIRASIHLASQDISTAIDAATLSVTPNGAVVVMKKSFPAETHLVIEHGSTKERVDRKSVV